MTNSAVIEFDQKMKRFEDAVREAGIKLTHQRIEIFREIASRSDHPDALAIHESVKLRMPTVSLDTIYRTLWTLTELGLIKTFGPRQENVRFDANLEQHHHFVCVKCGLVRDFESARFDQLDLQQDVHDIGITLNTQIEVRGMCNDCRGNSDTSTTNQ